MADRASGIDPSTLSFTFSNTPTTFTQSNVSAMDPINGFTWDRRYRDYQITVAATQLTPFGIEEPITMAGTVREFSTKVNNFSYSFNPAIAPWLTNLDPYHNQEQILPISDVRLRVRDDWAGVDPDSIVVTISHSGTTLGIFSGSDLHLEGVAGDALTDDFNIHIYSGTERNGKKLEFPIPNALNVANYIDVIVDVEDANGNSPVNPHDRYGFYTRYSCPSYPGCGDPLTVSMFQSGVWNNELYINPELYIT